jgi:hypothetical protein
MTQESANADLGAAAHANAARTAADEAKGHSEAAKKAAADAAAAKDAAEAIRKKFSRAIWYQIIQAVISVLTLAGLAFQGFYIIKQSDITEQQLRVAANTEELGIEQRLREGTQAIQKLVYDKNGVFAQAREVSCVPMPTDADKPAAQADFRLVLSHYELYHKAAKLKLIPKERWQAICKNATDLFGQNCLLKAKLDSEPNLDPDFRAAFIPKCEL